jgi:hypothetical protein
VVKEMTSPENGGKPPPVWGHVPGVPVGARFSGRGELAAANVHPQILRGIDFRTACPATCVVVAGGYQDDADKGA